MEQSCSPHGGQEAERPEEEVSKEKMYPSKPTPSDALPPAGPTSQFLPPSNNAIKLLIHRWINPLSMSQPS
jgi:hypothetical protein